MCEGFLQMKNSQSTTFMLTQSTAAQAQVFYINLSIVWVLNDSDEFVHSDG